MGLSAVVDNLKKAAERATEVSMYLSARAIFTAFFLFPYLEIKLKNK